MNSVLGSIQEAILDPIIFVYSNDWKTCKMIGSYFFASPLQRWQGAPAYDAGIISRREHSQPEKEYRSFRVFEWCESIKLIRFVPMS